LKSAILVVHRRVRVEGPPTERRSAPVRRGLLNVDDRWEIVYC
jgi:hypothetical protein